MSNAKVHPIFDSNAETVIAGVESDKALDSAAILAWRSWFAERSRRLQSSGGRPTDKSWSLKRQIPFSPETWKMLNELAAGQEGGGRSMTPGQLAAFLIEDMLQSRIVRGRRYDVPPPGRATRRADRCDLAANDPKFAGWKMPNLFSGHGTLR